MSTIETPPKIEPQEMLDSLVTPPNEDVALLVDKINEEYEYWDTVKYKKCPKGYPCLHPFVIQSFSHVRLFTISLTAA